MEDVFDRNKRNVVFVNQQAWVMSTVASVPRGLKAHQFPFLSFLSNFLSSFFSFFSALFLLSLVLLLSFLSSIPPSFLFLFVKVTYHLNLLGHRKKHFGVDF